VSRGVHGPGPGSCSTDNVRVQAGFGPGLNDSNQTLYGTGFIGPFCLGKK
jgi:hypothetical protein